MKKRSNKKSEIGLTLQWNKHEHFVCVMRNEKVQKHPKGSTGDWQVLMRRAVQGGGVWWQAARGWGAGGARGAVQRPAALRASQR